MDNDKFLKLERLVNELRDENKAIKRLLEVHQHSNYDGTKSFLNDLSIPSGMAFESGHSQFGELYVGGNYNAGIVTGEDRILSDGSTNSQFFIQHQANETFINPSRGPQFTAQDASITSGGTTMTQAKYTFETNALVGLYLYVNTSGTNYDAFPIASNTGNTITISGGTWTATVSNAIWLVYKPIYLGSAQYVFKRAYVDEGTAGGIRFGVGHTAGGQNGLLYMDATGDLYWRNKGGSATKLN